MSSEIGDEIVPSKSGDAFRNFSQTSAPNLSNETRRAVNAAFDAMSTWRTETLTNSEKSFEQVMEKMAEAARALGWPEQVVDATRSQIQSITKMQIQMVDQIMDAWEDQIKSPNPSQPILSKLQSFSSLGPVDAWSSASQMASMNPLQIYMEFAQQWQKAWIGAIAHWGQGRGT
jgi:hypothetical protein